MEKFDFDDILIQPADISYIESRQDILILDNNNFLPLFTAPMDTVIDSKNLSIFEKNGIIPIIPRTEKCHKLYDNGYYNDWIAFGLDEFIQLLNSNYTY
jgi:hypothetical protein